MDLVFEGGAEIRFSVEPPAEVHILGYYIMQMEDEEGKDMLFGRSLASNPDLRFLVKSLKIHCHPLIKQKMSQ